MNVTNIAEEMRESGKEVNDDDNVDVTILANLQQIQDQEAEILLRDLHEKVGIYSKITLLDSCE